MARQRVKSSALFHRGRRPVVWIVGVLMGGFGVGFFPFPSRSLAQTNRVDPPRPLLLGGAVQPTKHAVPLDPVLPHGDLRAAVRLEPLLKEARCSLRRPVCVTAPSTEEQERGLGLLERAFEEVAYGMGLPLQAFTPAHPLLWHQPGAVELRLLVRKRRSLSFDRGRGFCEGGALTLEMARRCVMGAATTTLSPATAEHLRGGFAASTARLLGEAPDASAVQGRSYAHPEIGVLTSTVRVDDSQGRGEVFVSTTRSSRFFDYLDARSQDALGRAGFYALTLAPTTTPAQNPRWEAEPDLLDVLRVSLGGDRNEVARLFDDFAVRSYFSARKNGQDMNLDWIVEGASLPRHLALSRALEPTGAAYVRIDLPEQGRHETIGFRISCEAPVSYVWSVTRLDERGREISRFPITFQERGGEAAGRVLPESGMASLLLVGSNLGGVDLAHPFDPDHGPHEAHGCAISINVVPADAAGKPN